MSHRLLLLALLWSSAPAAAGDPGAAEEAYQAAARDYYLLKRDPARRKFRHNWLNVVRRFEAVAGKYPKDPRAPDALFTSAELLAELSRFSALSEDLEAAVGHYRQLLKGYPKHRLADDGALALARIYAERLGRPRNAVTVLERGLSNTPKGDMAPQLRTLLASLRESLPPPSRLAARRPPAPKPAAAPEPAPPVAAVSPPPAEAAPTPPGPSSALAEAFARAVEAGAGTPQGSPAEPESAADPEPSAQAPPASVAKSPASKPPDAKARLAGVAKDVAGAELTLAEQLGLKFRRVVIDPGHGGHDSGAVGKRGTKEKDIALAISMDLAAILREAGIEVLLTRDRDVYLSLEERSRLANDHKGDLFISVHCNSAESRKLRGVSTFTLNTSADRYSIRLAARENSSSEKSISDLQFILADLATKANTSESQRLATRVQASLLARLSGSYSNIRDLGTREALFYVLLGAKMPAILVETSFLSHPEEEKRLSTRTYQKQVAAAIADGVQAFLGHGQRVAGARSTGTRRSAP